MCKIYSKIFNNCRHFGGQSFFLKEGGLYPRCPAVIPQLAVTITRFIFGWDYSRTLVRVSSWNSNQQSLYQDFVRLCVLVKTHVSKKFLSCCLLATRPLRLSYFSVCHCMNLLHGPSCRQLQNHM